MFNLNNISGASSGASFPGLDSEEVRNLLATETVTGSGEASVDQGEAMNRQGRAAVPPRGDSPLDQANLIRDLIREELRRVLGRRGRRSQREGSASSSVQEGSRSSRSRSSRRSHSPSSWMHTSMIP